MGSRWANYVLGELREAFPEVRAGEWNCRKISGSSTWSQHAWGNALDLHHVDWPYEVSDRNKAFLDPIHRWLKTYRKELSIRTMLWQTRHHFDHIHIDGWPKGYGQPPCDGGSLRMQYNDGRIVNGDPGPANGTPELPDRELVKVSNAQVLEKTMDGKAVADLQHMLISLGYDLGDWTPFGPDYPKGADGKFGQGTEDAVRAYQEERELIVTGKADGVTMFFIREDLGFAGQTELYPHTHGFVVSIPAQTIRATTEEAP